MHIFKESCINFLNFPENVFNELYSVYFQNNCTLLNLVVILYKRTPYIAPCLGVEGGGAKNTPMKSPTFSCNDRNQYFLG